MWSNKLLSTVVGKLIPTLLVMNCGITACSPEANGPGNEQTLQDRIFDGSNASFEKLLNPYIRGRQSLIVDSLPTTIDFRNFQSQIRDLRDQNTPNRLIAETGATYLEYTKDLSFQQKKLLLNHISYGAMQLFDYDLEQAAELELVRTFAINSKLGSPRLLYPLAAVWSFYVYNGNLHKARQILIFLNQSAFSAEQLIDNFFPRLLVFSGHRAATMRDTSKSIEYIKNALELLQSFAAPRFILTELYSELLKMQAQGDHFEDARKTATTLASDHSNELTPRSAQFLSSFLIHEEQFHEALEVLEAGQKTGFKSHGSSYWVNEGMIITLLGRLGRTDQVSSRFAKSFGSFSQFSWNDDTKKMEFPDHFSLIGKDSCLGWMDGLRIAGSALNNPGIVGWLAKNLTDQDDFYERVFTEECVVGLARAEHFGAFQIGDFPKAIENALKFKKLFFNIFLTPEINTRVLVGWGNAFKEMFSDLKDPQSGAEVNSAILQELYRRNNLSAAVDFLILQVIFLHQANRSHDAGRTLIEGKERLRSIFEQDEKLRDIVKILEMYDLNPDSVPNAILSDYFKKYSFEIGVAQDWKPIPTTFRFDITSKLDSGNFAPIIRELQKEITQRTSRLGESKDLAYNYREIYEVLLANGQENAAFLAINAAFNLLEIRTIQSDEFRNDVPIRFWHREKDILLNYLRAQTHGRKSQGEIEKAFSASQRYAETLTTRKLRRSMVRQNETRSQIISDWAGTQDSINQHLSSLDPKRNDQLLLDLLETDQKLRAQIRDAHPKFFANYFQNPPTIKEIQTHLEPKEALVFFIKVMSYTDEELELESFDVASAGLSAFGFSPTKESDYLKKTLIDRRAFVWVITKDEARLQYIPQQAEMITSLVNEVRASLEIDPGQIKRLSELPRFNSQAANNLYEILFRPIETYLSDVQNLVIVANGNLTSLPFDALLISDPPESSNASGDYRDYEWLIDRYKVTTLPSVETFRMLRERDKSVAILDSFVGFGDPNFAAGFLEQFSLDQIPLTRTTILELADLIGTNKEALFLGKNASESNVKTAELDQSQVIAFATHGLLPNQINGLEESGLALSSPSTPTELDDGVLTSTEVASLEIQSPLVILSACNTGVQTLGTSELGLPSLGLAFFYAGADSLVASHWLAEATTTNRVITDTIRNLVVSSNRGASHALRDAKRAFLDSSAPAWSSHPMFWATFFSIGAN